MRKAYLQFFITSFPRVDGISLYALGKLFNRLYTMLKFVITIYQSLTKMCTTFAFLIFVLGSLFDMLFEDSRGKYFARQLSSPSTDNDYYQTE